MAAQRVRLLVGDSSEVRARQDHAPSSAETQALAARTTTPLWEMLNLFKKLALLADSGIVAPADAPQVRKEGHAHS